MNKTIIALSKYIRKNRLKQIDFCRLCEISRFSLHKYLRGHRMHPFIARRIEEKTEGAIKVKDLID